MESSLSERGAPLRRLVPGVSQSVSRVVALMRFRLFALLLLLCPVDAAVAQAPDPDPARPNLPAWTRSIVKIFISCEGGLWTGTGTVVSDRGHVITAAHIGSACVGRPTQIRVGFIENPYREPPQQHPARLLWRRSDGVRNAAEKELIIVNYEDVALYQIDNLDTRDRRIEIETRVPLPGEAITIAGFSNYPFKGLPHSSIGGLSLYPTHVSSVAADGNLRPFRLHYSGSTMSGMSGGPVVNDAGRLIGVHSARRHDDTTAAGGVSNVLTNYAWATSMNAVNDLLEQEPRN